MSAPLLSLNWPGPDTWPDPDRRKETSHRLQPVTMLSKLPKL